VDANLRFFDNAISDSKIAFLILGLTGTYSFETSERGEFLTRNPYKHRFLYYYDFCSHRVWSSIIIIHARIFSEQRKTNAEANIKEGMKSVIDFKLSSRSQAAALI
jgi:hypothetical protein